MDTLFSFKIDSYTDKSLSEAIEEIFNNSVSAKALCAESRVLLKPNLLAKHAPSAAVTTHPEVLRQVILALLRRGVKDITVADSPGGTYKPEIMNSIYAVCGLAQVCAETGVKLYSDCKFAAKTADGKLCRSWNFIEPVLNCDFIINLPKMKTHMMMNLSCGVKNLFGCIPGLQKAELHMRFPQKEHFATMLCDLYEAVMPQLTIADGIIGMQGNGPAGGTPRFCGRLLASDSAAVVDLAACKLMGFAPTEILYLTELMRRGLCPKTLADTKIYGDKLTPITDFKRPSSSGNIDFTHKVPRIFAPLVRKALSATSPRPKIQRRTCIGCGKCAEICPASVISIKDKKAVISPQSCIKCFCCHEVCPVKAIAVKSFALFKI